MTYEQFISEFWTHLKRGLIEPTLSIGELLLLLALIAYKPPWWINGPVMLAWMIWRINRNAND